MAEWKKVVVSGSDISQLNNDANYLINGQSGASLTGSFSGSFVGTTNLPDLTSGEGVAPFTYDGSATATVAVSGAADLSNNAVTKWNDIDGKFANSNITDDGTLVTIDSNTTVSGSLTVTGNVIGTGSLKLQPDSNDARYLEIYNTAAQDTHITASGGWLFLGDDTTYVKVDNYSTNNSMELRADNGISVTGSLTVSGSDITFISSNFAIGDVGEEVLFADASGIYFYDANGSSSIDVSNRYLNNSSGTPVVDWENGLFSGSFSGSFQGNGSGLTDIPASGITGLNLSMIATGSVTASVNVGTNAFTIVSGSATLHNIRANGGFENGLYVTASGAWSHAEGGLTNAAGAYSHAEGEGTTAYGSKSHAEGYNTVASGSYSHAEGNATIASGSYSHSEGQATIALGESSHAEGNMSVSSGDFSHAEGQNTTATGYASHTEGGGTIASAQGSHAEGQSTTASGSYSHAEGYSTIASSDYSHAEGYDTTASGYASHAEGNGTISSGSYSHAEGYGTTASGYASHAEGNTTTASNYYSHAEGNNTTASGQFSHAEGNGTTALGDGSHAEGLSTIASGSYSHAEGEGTTASGYGSHTEGSTTTASGNYSHAEGYATIALGLYSHAEGMGTIASGSGQLAAGRYNTENNTDSLLVIGNGTNFGNRSDLALFNSQSIVFNQPVTGSVFTGSFVGDGSGLTGVTATAGFALSQSTGITAFSYNGSATAAVEISGSATLSANTITKWTGNAFANTSITDDGALVTVSNDALFTGDITVQGTASFQNTQNLLVADRFVLFASGSNTTGDGGIVVQQGTQNVGELFGYDSTSTRWGFTSSFAADASGFTPAVYVGAVQTGTGQTAASAAPIYGGASFGYGTIHIDTDDSEIWIYA